MYAKILIAVGVVMLVILAGELFFRLKRMRIKKLLDDVARIPIERIPDAAAGFAAFLKEVRNTDLAAMPYAGQVEYILSNFASFRQPEMGLYVSLPETGMEGRALVIGAAGAYLGELVRSIHPARWIEDRKNPGKPPRLEVNCSDGGEVPCNPFEMLLFACTSGKNGGARVDLLMFQSPEILAENIRVWRNGTVYSEEEMENFKAGLERNFAPIKTVCRETASGDDGMHVDVFILAPTDAYPAQRLVTCGMGARRMTLPGDAEGKPERIELMMDLPPEWDVNDDFSGDELRWPLKVLRHLARFPWRNNSWLGCGHTIPWPEPLARNTKQNGVLLEFPMTDSIERTQIEVAPGKKIQILQVVPLYQEEMDYKKENGAEKLMELWKENFSFVVNPYRRNSVTGK